MDLHYQEHLDHVMGSYSNDHQAAFDHSRIEWHAQGRDDQAKINRLTAEGKFVVAVEVEVYCRSTDAIMGSEIFYEANFDSLEEANQHISSCRKILKTDHDDGMFVVCPYTNRVERPEAQVCEDDIPF